jgi:guanylate kinase
LALSVSHTTRNPRPGETDGHHYHFVDDADFIRTVEEGAFLEHAQVFDYRYGTHRNTVESLMDRGLDVILEIDWQGAQQVRESFPESRSVFIMPPSVEALQSRLSGRGQDSPEVIARRMRDARAEMSHWDEFDFLIINDIFEHALTDLNAIIRARHLSRFRQARKYANLLAELLGNR